MTIQAAEILVFDPTAVDKLRVVAGDQGSTFVAEIAQLFLDETKKSIVELKAARDKSDWTKVTRIAHSLKSSAATLGLMRLSNACMALEIETKNGTSGERARVLAAEVVVEFYQSVPILQTLV